MTKIFKVKAICKKCGSEQDVTEHVDKRQFYKEYPLAKKADTEVTLDYNQCKNCKKL